MGGVLVVLVVGGAWLVLDRGAGGGGTPEATTTAGREGATTASGEAGRAGRGRATPDETVDAFVAAAYPGDCEEMAALITDGFFDGVTDPDEICAVPVEVAELSVEFGELRRTGDVRIEGDEAVVRTVRPLGGKVDFELVREDGLWLLDGFTVELAPGPDGAPLGVDLEIPEDVVWLFVAEGQEGDCWDMVEYATDDLFAGASRDEAIADCDDRFRNDEARAAFDAMEITGPAAVTGDTATVVMETPETSYTFHLVHGSGGWRVDAVQERP